MLRLEIEATLAGRDAGHANGLRFQPICEIEYQDDAKMTTLVGLVVDDEDAMIYPRCGFDRLDFISDDGRPIKIDMPKLTIRELRYIEQQLPLNGGDLSLGAIPQSDANKFIKMYRYFPNFAVMEA